jgi:halimadienyl-diphosphate synthase
MPNWYEELYALFKDKIGKGEMAGTAYDTAWVASIPDPEHPDRPAFPQALEWLRLHQHSDGSWGAEIESHQDRVLSTLVVAIVVAEWLRDDLARYQVEAGLKSIWRRLATLDRDTFELVGFELILPTLLNRARSLGFKLPYPHFDLYSRLREKKIALIPTELLYSRFVTSTFSLEFMGDDIDESRLDGELQERNGSIATSPSATSYYLRHAHNDRAMAYIRRVVKSAMGAIPALDSIDVFEAAWAVYNVYWLKEEVPEWARPPLQILKNAWADRGVAANSVFSVRDADDTAMAFLALARAGDQPDPTVFARYELDDHFMCYPYERTPSISAHVHLLEALTVSAPFEGRERMIRKVKDFLVAARKSGIYWLDKWHASPYYTTAHAMISLSAIAPDELEHAVDWIVQTQREDGSWGYYGDGTAEETAYCLQAMILYRKRGGQVPSEVLDRAYHYLANSTERHYAHYKALWSGKTLYAPTWVNHTTVLSSLILYESAVS